MTTPTIKDLERRTIEVGNRERTYWLASGPDPSRQGGGHGWPGAPPYLPARLLGRIPSDFDATGILLSFAGEILAATPPPTQTEADP